MAVENGDTVTIDFTGYLEDGRVFDSSLKSEPLTFVVGREDVVQGINDAVLGMEVGHEKEIFLKKDEAFGSKHQDAIQKISKEKFPGTPEQGKIVDIPLPGGEKLPITIAGVEKGSVTVDTDHPLAGKRLRYKIKVKEIVKPTLR